jgi:hypothetical protein
MRGAVLAALVTLLVGASAHAQATVSPCTTFGPGSPSCPYQWVGVTSVAFTGDGNGLGFVGMTTQCRADFGAGARMCKSDEIQNSDSLNPNSIPASGCWVRPSWRGWESGRALDDSGVTGLANGGLAGSGDAMSCFNWSINDSAFNGLVLSSSGSTHTAGCQNPRPAACCKPIAVGEPQASLMLPTGVGVLAVLSVLKGEA